MIDKRFTALEGLANSDDYLICTYFYQTHQNPIRAAVELCKSQSTSSAGWGTSGRVAGEDSAIVERYGAKLLHYDIVEAGDSPDMPPVAPELQRNGYGKLWRASARIAIPVGNLGSSIALLLTAVAGEIHNLDPFISIKLIDVEFPIGYLERYAGPKFGATEVRKRLGAEIGRPLLIGVIKPSLAPTGLFAELAYQSLIGGLDMVKDDELLVDIDESPLVSRVRAVSDAAKRAADHLGRKVYYQANITADLDQLLRNHDLAVANGADLVMVNAMAVGLAGTRLLTQHSEVPVTSHFDMTACNAKVPFHGVSHKVWAKLHRLAGLDNVVVPAPGATQMEYSSDIADEITVYQEPMGSIRPSQPFFGGGVKATNLGAILDAGGIREVGMIIGHGVYAHPAGALAGARSVVQAWEAYRDGIAARHYALSHPELQSAFDHFEKPPQGEDKGLHHRAS